MSAPSGKHVEPSKTLFIRNLPYTTTESKLEEVFSDVGPVKRCFLIRDKETGKGKGYGYVIYSMLEDAVEAKAKVKKVDGRNVFVQFADHSRKKVREKNPHAKREKKEEKVVTEDFPDAAKSTETSEQTSSTPSKESEKADPQSSKYERAKTVVVTGFSSDLDTPTVDEAIRNVKNVKKVVFPVRDRPTPTVILLFKCVRDSKRAVRRLNGRDFKGQTLQACQLSTEFSQSRPELKTFPPKETSTRQRRARLIIRNLSFQCTEGDLRTNFSKFGEIIDAVIPKRNDGRQQGFGFVEFTEVTAAEKALTTMNMKQIKGRPVAVDWTVPKDTYQKETGVEKSTKTEATSPDEGSFSAGAEEESDSTEEDTSRDAEESSSEDEGFSDKSGSDDSEEADSDAQSDSDDGKRLRDKRTGNKKAGKLREKANQLKEGCTLFIRNINFDSQPDDLQELLEEFGEMDYCKMVYDQFTEKPKGTAFVQYKSEDSAKKCLQKANEESVRGGLVLDGRRLNVIKAVSRQDAARLTQEAKTKEKDDKRNLYLAREGLIRPGTQAAIGLSKADLDKRLKVESVKRQKLKNPNIFISPQRLCIRNIPVKTTDKELKKVFLKAAGDKNAKITECRIMKDMTQVNSQGEAKSRGYGFVEFTEHDHAVEALRKTNNNPEVFGEKRRPIVEFSLENKTALEAKKKRLDRIKAKQDTLSKGSINKAREPRTKKGKAVDTTTTATKPSLVSGRKMKALGDKVEKGKRPKVMPSHYGPKIRQRDRGKSVTKKKQKQGNQDSRKQIRDQKSVKRPASGVEWKEPKKKKAKSNRREKTDDFDSMVNKYRNKILSASSKPGVKWFADS